jgi:hypothetical protein
MSIKQTEKVSKKIKSNCRNKITKTKIILDSDSEKESDIEQENDDDYDYDYDEEIILDNLTNKKLIGYKSDLISKFIVKDKIYDYNSKSIMCYYLWSGVNDLDRWELNRKIDTTHVKKIYKEMVKDYEKKSEFIFYEPVQLAIKTDNILYVIDGQHRLLACNKLYKKNKYPIQQIPCVLWFPNSEEEFIEIFDKINSRTPIDKSKLFNYKILDIINWMDKNMGSNELIWGKFRPKINKDLFVEKMRESDSVHKLETSEIIKKINDYNIKQRGMPRTKRCDKSVNDSVHNHAESIDFFLGYDKELKWIEQF